METCWKPVNLRKFQYRVQYPESRFFSVTSKLSFVRENLILYKSALTLWTTFVTYSRSHSHDDLLQSDSLLFGCIHVSFGTLLKQISDYFNTHNNMHWCVFTDSFDRSLLATVEFPLNAQKINLLFCININIVLVFIPMTFIINFNASFALNPSYPKFKIKFYGQCQK